MKIRQSILGLVAFAAIMVVAGAAYASCWGSNRVTFHYSECLHGWWDNNPWPSKSTFGVQGSCKDWGTVVAKIDLASCTDKTWHLNHNNKRRGSEACRVNGIYCCRDVGDLCNWDDVTTIAGCTSQWDKSPASDTCDLSGGTTYTSGGTTHEENVTHVTAPGNNCSFWAKCDYTADDGTTQENQTSIENVFWPDCCIARNMTTALPD